MKRYSILYTLEEDEFNAEIQRLMVSSYEYIRDYYSDLEKANDIIEGQDFELALREIAKLRQSLAKADYRLHDVMGLIAAHTQPANVDPSSAPPQQTSSAMATADLSASLEEVKRNIEALGIDVTEEQMMRMLKEKASNG